MEGSRSQRGAFEKQHKRMSRFQTSARSREHRAIASVDGFIGKVERLLETRNRDLVQQSDITQLCELVQGSVRAAASV